MEKERARFPAWATAAISVVITIVAAVAVIALIIISVMGLLTGDGQGSKAFSGPSSPYIARIKIVGEISSAANQNYSSDAAYHHTWTIQTIDTLIGDPNNKGICLWLDTPGGSVYECDELYLKLMEYKEKTGRPVYAYMEQMAASGGYYTAAAADEIYANRNTWTGSIGVTLGTVFDVSDFLESHGIHTDTITSGRNKAMGSYYTPLTDEQKQIYQGLVDDAYDRFVSIVAKGRNMPESKVRTLGDGRLYTAGQALDDGLIDGILGETEAEDAIKAKFDDGAVIYDCYYRPVTNYLSMLGSIFGSGQGIWDLLRGNADSSAGNQSLNDSTGSAYEGDIAAVLELAREQAEAGVPSLNYLCTAP